jgi:hypothetical protein
MNAIITVFKTELAGKEHVIKEIVDCCSSLDQIAEAFIINPRDGRLFEVIEMLRKNKISYGTHFNTAP